MARVLVLGAYGLIGAEVARRLTRGGHDVVALGRDLAVARRVLPGYHWVIRDLRRLIKPDDWQPLLDDVDAVVNCAGALQQNPRDDLESVHLRAIGALVLACERRRIKLIQISAVGAHPHEKLAFFRTKAEGDALIRESSVEWWIFRPGMVIAPSSYGGTTLIRALAGVPIVQPIALANAPVQTVAVADVARAVSRALDGEIPPGTIADLVEDETHPLVDLVGVTRRWLGFPTARLTLALPEAGVRLIGRIADIFGKLGWRSPLRTTAIESISRGITGDARQTRRALGRPAMSLEETLLANPARMEDRLFARTHMLSPFLIFSLALAWIWKGLAGVADMESVTAVAVLNGAPEFPTRVAIALVAVLALAVGSSMILRRWTSRALVVSALVLIFYAAAVSLLQPGLWFDPFGAGINVLPLLMATLTARVLLDTR